jgi:steroid delta-isomerase-like uncharacterized protein
MDNTAIIQQLVEDVWNKRTLAVIDELFTAEAVVHDPAVPAVTDVESLKQFIAAYLVAFPDLQLTLDDCFATNEKVAVRWTIHGTHKGAFLGVAPTEQPVTITGMTLYHLTNSRVTECWIQWDSSGLVQQLGSSTKLESSKTA